MDQLPVSSTAPDSAADAEPDLLCAQVRRMASIALGVDMGHSPGAVRQAAVDAFPTHPNPASVAWPGQIACPYRPVGMRDGYYMFEERYPARGYGRRQVYLSDRQLRFGEIAGPLDLREDWLAEQFPVAGGNFEEWDIVAVVAWIRHHITAATTTRRDRGQRDTPKLVAAEPRPAPETWSMHFEPSSPSNSVAAVRSLTITRDDRGKRSVALTISLPGARDLISVGVKLPGAASLELADVLRGVVAL